MENNLRKLIQATTGVTTTGRNQVQLDGWHRHAPSGGPVIQELPSSGPILALEQAHPEGAEAGEQSVSNLTMGETTPNLEAQPITILAVDGTDLEGMGEGTQSAYLPDSNLNNGAGVMG